VILVLHGLDQVSHLFLRYGMPAGFGDVAPEEEEKYGAVLSNYYRFLDQWLGRFVEKPGAGRDGGSVDEGSAFLVVSPHGIEPLPLGRRLLERLAGSPFTSGYHSRGPDGMILAAGPGIRHGVPLGRASVVDLVPTLLYYYRLPVGMDMDGHPLTRLFNPAFTSENPILLIPSYESRGEPYTGGRAK
jgi:predicted AlkP superfamily phosphohydrolase/phosphomutase